MSALPSPSKSKLTDAGDIGNVSENAFLTIFGLPLPTDRELTAPRTQNAKDLLFAMKPAISCEPTEEDKLRNGSGGSAYAFGALCDGLLKSAPMGEGVSTSVENNSANARTMLTVALQRGLMKISTGL